MTTRGRPHPGLLPVLGAFALLVGLLPRPVHAEGVRVTAEPRTQSALDLSAADGSAAEANPSLYFAETGFGIDDPRFADYFARRGGVATFGFPTSRAFQLLGLPTQLFQRRALQLGPAGDVRALNLLDDGLLPYTRVNGSTFPAPDDRLAAAAPSPDRPNYAVAVAEFVRRNAPETFDGQPVRFLSTFNSTVSLADAFPEGRGDARLLPLLNLEIWGVPTSVATRDPNNGNFVYQRFQRGIMHYDAACRCTQGLLLADYFKALLTGEGLPPDLEEQARGSAFLRQYSPDLPRGLTRPAALPGTDVRGAFARQSPPTAGARPAGVAPPLVGAPTAAPMRSQLRVDQGLWAAIDALEELGNLGLLNAMLQSGTEVRLGDLTQGVHARYTRQARGPRQPPARSIVVSTRWRAADPKALAAVLAHEGKHLQDDLADSYVPSFEGCVQFEVRAFTEQSLVWQGFYGPGGKVVPRDELDGELNGWLAVYRRGPAEQEQQIRQLYAEACRSSTRRGH